MIERRTFIKKLIGWLAAFFIMVGLGWLGYHLLGEDKHPPDQGAADEKSKGNGKTEKNGLHNGLHKEGEAEDKMIPKRKLGKTGISVSLFSLGGEATVEKMDRAAQAEEIINRAIDLGINYIDTAPTYGGGGSESNIGRVMDYRRDEVFLASKTGDRTYDGTMKLVEQSLERLQTDYLDLYQLHNVRTTGDLEQAFGNKGAIKALEELKGQGVIRFTGITGHKDPDVLLQGIKEYPFDCMLMSFNAGDIHYASFQEKLLQEAVKLEMGIIAMKVTARGRIFQEGGLSSMQQALDYVFSFPISTAIVGISSVEEVEENARIAADFKELGTEEIKKLADLTKSYADEANFFKHHW